jgi:hypothetical protein
MVPSAIPVVEDPVGRGAPVNAEDAPGDGVNVRGGVAGDVADGGDVPAGDTVDVRGVPAAAGVIAAGGDAPAGGAAAVEGAVPAEGALALEEAFADEGFVADEGAVAAGGVFNSARNNDLQPLFRFNCKESSAKTVSDDRRKKGSISEIKIDFRLTLPFPLPWLIGVVRFNDNDLMALD